MGSVRFQGVRFRAYSDDHSPRHVHGFYAGLEVIVDLRRDGNVTLSTRHDCVKPGNGSRADVRHVLDTAAEHFARLVALWEERHG